MEGHTLTTFGFPVLQLRSEEVTKGFRDAPVWARSIQRVVGMVGSILGRDSYGKLVETASLFPVNELPKSVLA